MSPDLSGSGRSRYPRSAEKIRWTNGLGEGMGPFQSTPRSYQSAIEWENHRTLWRIFGSSKPYLMTIESHMEPEKSINMRSRRRFSIFLLSLAMFGSVGCWFLHINVGQMGNFNISHRRFFQIWIQAQTRPTHQGAQGVTKSWWYSAWYPEKKHPRR